MAKFQQVNKGRSNVHHDALEFPDGKIVLLTHLCKGQRATVLQLPARPRITVDDAATVRFARRVADYCLTPGCRSGVQAQNSGQPLCRRHSMQEHKNEKLLVRYDPAICIHAGECIRGLPSVFSLSRKPWIDVNGASAAAIVEQVKRCPSGALNFGVP